ncbi:hypothetical protein ACFW9D_07950 [Streptomyces sp. NPDC059524]|uniref:hypothetical protein n=1 Tax=Streptomyces sp. NPDC059524 TaxID=3346856 RepID=UPI0036A49817
MKVEGETLAGFKRRVDALLRELDGSKAAPHSIGNGRLAKGRLGAFDEADDLHSAYTHVHTQLENLSKMLALQIEALGVTVKASKSGYENLDDDVRAQLARIRSRANDLTGDGSPHRRSPAGERDPAPRATDGAAGGL